MRPYLRHGLSLLARQRGLATWSPLATAFNSPPKKKSFFAQESVGMFLKEELRSPEGWEVLRERAVRECGRLVQEALEGGRAQGARLEGGRPLVQVFDELSDTVCQVADLAEFVRVAHPERAHRRAAAAATHHLSSLVERLNTNRALYDALREASAAGTSGDAHLASLFLFDFEQSGIGLEEEARAGWVRLTERILHLGQQFMAAAAEPARLPRRRLPPHLAERLSAQDGCGGGEGGEEEVVVSTWHVEAREEAVREAAYRAYLAPCASQHARLAALLQARARLAALAAYPSYAARAIRGSTMDSAANVALFLDAVSELVRPLADLDYRDMALLKREESEGEGEGGGGGVRCWDTAYLGLRARQRCLHAHRLHAYSSHLSLGACMQGLDYVTRHLYGVTLRHEEMLPGEAWADEVRKVAVVDEGAGGGGGGGGEVLGWVYCDLVAREHKPPHDCHFTIRAGRQLPCGRYQQPVVVVMMSLQPPHPQQQQPIELSTGALDNLFHEWGHALHSMLGRARYQHVAGTRTHTDLAEMPAILMEYFAQEPRVLAAWARCWRTGRALPEEAARALHAVRHVYAAHDLQLQTMYSILDQRYHGVGADELADSTRTLREVHEQHYSLPWVEGTAWQHRFSHLVGYGAKYYSYLISRALASAAWHENFLDVEAGAWREPGGRLRELLLAPGGALPPRDLLSRYLRTDLAPPALAAQLRQDLLHHQRRHRAAL